LIKLVVDKLSYETIALSTAVPYSAFSNQPIEISWSFW
jgi:hypothetical protein